MSSSEGTRDDRKKSGGIMQELAISASDSIVENLSSVAGSAFNEGKNRVKDFSLKVCRENLDRMARERSIVKRTGVRGIDGSTVVMSPIINAMLRACAFSLGVGHGGGRVWVVCAPADQGKSAAAHFILHGRHNLAPERAIMIDATSMENFPRDFAKDCLSCTASEQCLSTLLCEALSDTAPSDKDAKTNLAKLGATVVHAAGKYVCVAAQTETADNKPIEMRGADKHTIIKVETSGDKPSPILIIDEFYCNTDANTEFVRNLIRDASATGVVVFLMTCDEKWATKLAGLNHGTKCKPLPFNVSNDGYDGCGRFEGTPKWNGMYWKVEELREFLRPLCEKRGVKPEDAVPENSRLTPGGARENVARIFMKPYY